MVAAAGTPKYPFPQNRESPGGTTVKYADPSVIKAHFDKWKQAWYQNKAAKPGSWSPEGTSSTVSEGIAYGMMIMVYMSAQNDDQTQAEFGQNSGLSPFDLKNNSVASNGGMNWRIGSGGGTGSATDADVDAALALVMANAQWGDSKYLTAAKSLISWMASNDIDGNNSVKPGSNWNDAFNPVTALSRISNFRQGDGRFQMDYREEQGGAGSSRLSEFLHGPCPRLVPGAVISLRRPPLPSLRTISRVLR